MTYNELENFNSEQKLKLIKNYLEDLYKKIEDTEPAIEADEKETQYWNGQYDLIKKIIDFIN